MQHISLTKTSNALVSSIERPNGTTGALFYVSDTQLKAINQSINQSVMQNLPLRRCIL